MKILTATALLFAIALPATAPHKGIVMELSVLQPVVVACQYGVVLVKITVF